MIGELDSFFKAIEKVQGSIRSAIHSNPKGEIRDTFLGLLDIIESHKEKLAAEGPAAFQKAREKLAADKAKFSAITGKAEGLFAKIRALMAKCDSVAEKGRAIVEQSKEKQIPPANRPPKLAKQQRPAFPLSKGDALRNFLCMERAALSIKPLRGPNAQPLGNIWDDWGPIHSDSKPWQSDTEPRPGFDEESDED